MLHVLSKCLTNSGGEVQMPCLPQHFYVYTCPINPLKHSLVILQCAIQQNIATKFSVACFDLVDGNYDHPLEEWSVKMTRRIWEIFKTIVFISKPCRWIIYPRPKGGKLLGSIVYTRTRGVGETAACRKHWHIAGSGYNNKAIAECSAKACTAIQGFVWHTLVDFTL